MRPVTAIWGIGSQTAPTLQKAGIRTAQDLAAADPTDLHARFGLQATIDAINAGEGRRVIRNLPGRATLQGSVRVFL